MVFAPDIAEIHRNLVAFSSIMAELGGGEVSTRDGATMYSIPNGPTMLSGVLECDVRTPPRRSLSWGAAALSASSWGLWIPDLVDNAGLHALAVSIGLRYVGDSPAMVLTEAPPVAALPGGISLSQSRSPKAWTDFWAVCEQSFAGTDHSGALKSIFAQSGVSVPKELYPMVAYDHTGCAVGSALSVDIESLAGLYWIGVTKDARRAGIGLAITSAAASAAQSRGAKAVILQSSPMGYDLYRALGFETTFTYGCWTHAVERF